MKHPTRTLIDRKSPTGEYKSNVDESPKSSEMGIEQHDPYRSYMPCWILGVAKSHALGAVDGAASP